MSTPILRDSHQTFKYAFIGVTLGMCITFLVLDPSPKLEVVHCFNVQERAPKKMMKSNLKEEGENWYFPG